MPLYFYEDVATYYTLDDSYIHRGSDDMVYDINKKRSGVTIERYGVPIAQRNWKSVKNWTLQINSAPRSVILDLLTWYEKGTFTLKTSLISGGKKVIWDGDFDAIYIAPNQYSLTANFRERI
jgi:hypothetical protein